MLSTILATIGATNLVSFASALGVQAKFNVADYYVPLLLMHYIGRLADLPRAKDTTSPD